MQKLSLDFETYSECDIKKHGAWIYSKHPTTEVICAAYSVDGAKPKLWISGQELPSELKNIKGYEVHAWNSFFEYAIVLNVLKLDPGPLEQWFDTMADAARLSLPLSLAKCGEALMLPEDQQKLKRGSYLIQRLCKPNRGLRLQSQDLLDELYEYCLQDVVTEMSIAEILKKYGLST